MAYPAQLQQQQPMQAPAPAYQQVLPRASVQMQAPRTAQLSAVGNVATERAEAQRTSFQVYPCWRVRHALDVHPCLTEATLADGRDHDVEQLNFVCSEPAGATQPL
jgi:hypothetical protein